MLKLPKGTLKNPRCADIEALFTKSQRLLRPQGLSQASFWKLDRALTKALKSSTLQLNLLQGLEQIDSFLAKEAKGLQLVQKKSNQAEVHRLSRLLLLANDGSERFYHDVDSLLQIHKSRIWAVVIAAPSDVLGSLTTARGSPVKAMLISDRKALELFLDDLI